MNRSDDLSNVPAPLATITFQAGTDPHPEYCLLH